ncbi:MAG TPA: MarR family transcriptional regulator [Bacillota bacterium]|nr:MarR family transcriptional regulator [Bacillota bacterium]
MNERFNAELVPYHLDAKEYGLLSVITSMPEATQQQIGEAIHVDRTSMVKRVDHLESLGYIVRIKNTIDRRTYNLQLTDSGNRILNDLWPTLINCERDVLSPLSDEEVQQIRILFNKWIKAFR